MVLLCHAYHTSMFYRYHDNGPFFFRALSSSFVIVHVLRFILHNFIMFPSIIFLRICTHCQMFAQQPWLFFDAFVVDQFH